MASPGYPQMGQMPPMGGPPMGGPPMGRPPQGGPPPGGQRPMRRGVSKAVPIVVSAGLAVGVFCGLLFGVGKGSEAVAAAPAKGSNAKPAGDATKPGAGAAPAGLGAAKPSTPTAGSAAGSGSAVAAAGSAAPAAGSGSAAAGSATPTVVAPTTIKLTVTLKPAEAMEKAKLYIDGKVVEGMTAELPVDTKSVKVNVRASGYHSVSKTIDLSAGQDLTVEFETARRQNVVRPPKRPDRPPSGGGGLIDI